MQIQSKDVNTLQLSVLPASALTDTLAIQYIKSRESEMKLLFSLWDAMKGVKNGEDLFAVLSAKLSELLPVKDFVLLVINPNNETWRQFPYPNNEVPNNGRTRLSTSTEKHSKTYDGLFHAILEFDNPYEFVLDNLLTASVPEYIYRWKLDGVEKIIALPLKSGNEKIGVLYMQEQEAARVEPFNYNIAKAIASQISVVVSGILANEEIAKRESERELLLSLSIEIAAVRSNDELLHVLNNRLKTLLGFTHNLVGTINEDGTTASAFLIDPETIAKKHPLFDSAKQGKYPVDDGVMNKAAVSEVPLVYDLAQLNELQKLPIYFQLNFESGIKQAVITRFSKGGKAFGFWMIFYDRKCAIDNRKFGLINALAHQISIAVSNIIANSDIQEREREKSRILSFSNAIASVRDKNVLAKMLKRQLNELFHIEDYIIHAISENKKTHHPILYDLNANFANHPDFQKLLNIETELNDSVFNSILCSSAPVTFDADNWFRSQKPYSEAVKPIGLKQMTAVPICMGEENIAIMIFRQDEENRSAIQKNLFRSICSQIAITVANLIANEKMNKQLCEIDRYKQQLEEEKTYLKEEIQTTQNYAEIIGDSPEMKKTFQLVAQVASSDSTVLLLGETGTGKELIARAIHNASHRKDNLMIKVNCAALPANLIESELFGHERGSFTGAIERRIGKFELANKGTLFLDEIGEMPFELQVKLLRALQEREIERVGGRQTIKVDVRIIAATNRNLEKETREGRFRLDLFYRLNVFPIYLPPLRERKQDIPALATYFVSRFAHKAGKKISALSAKVLHELSQYPWPGNIRELEHLMERGVLLSNGDSIAQITLPVPKQNSTRISSEDRVIIKTIDENERDHILSILKYCNGRISGTGGAAELLGIPPSTLNSKVKKLGIRKEHSL